MRRALLLAAALAVPGLGAAQNIGSGELQFVQPGTTNDITHGKWINGTECAERTTTDVLLQWNTKVTSGTFPAQAAYEIWVSNQALAAGATECVTTGDATKDLVVTKIADVTGKLQTVIGYAVKVDPLLTAVGATCSVTTNVPIYVCVKLVDNSGAGAKGLATGTITLSLTKPSTPPSLSVGPVDSGKLRVSWTEPNVDPVAAYDYVVRAHSVVSETDPTRDPLDQADHDVDPTDPHVTSVTLGGLTDGVLYQVFVASRSEAGNESDPAAGPAYGTPVPVADFWELYSQTPGAVEQGGCATGGAGPLALAGLAALVAALRRRK